MHSYFKVFYILVSTIALWITFTPPNLPPDKGEGADSTVLEVLFRQRFLLLLTKVSYQDIKLLLKLLICQSAFWEHLHLHCSCRNSSHRCSTCTWPIWLRLGAVVSHSSWWDCGTHQHPALIYHWSIHGNSWRPHKTWVLSTIGHDVYLWDEHSKGSYTCHVGTLWCSSPSRIYWNSSCHQWDVAFACIWSEFILTAKITTIKCISGLLVEGEWRAEY